MKIATYNVNGINGRLPVLLRWLGEAEPEVDDARDDHEQRDHHQRELHRGGTSIGASVGACAPAHEVPFPETVRLSPYESVVRLSLD